MVGLSLAVVSAACGVLALWIFAHTTDLAAVRTSVKRVQAHLLEFRLFYDEPRLIWDAQKAIVRENVRFLALVTPAVIILAIPTWWLLVQLDAVYGYAPLSLDQASVVTVQLNHPVADVAATLQVPPGISIETPPVRSLADRQISWRIRPLRPVRGSVRVSLHGAAIETAIAAARRSIFLRRRVGPLLHWRGDIAWIEVDYPKADVSIAGIALPWIAWFVLISTLSAIVFRRLLR